MSGRARRVCEPFQGLTDHPFIRGRRGQSFGFFVVLRVFGFGQNRWGMKLSAQSTPSGRTISIANAVVVGTHLSQFFIGCCPLKCLCSQSDSTVELNSIRRLTAIVPSLHLVGLLHFSTSGVGGRGAQRHKGSEGSRGKPSEMGHWDHLGMPEHFDGIVRLFPLPNLVLFPNVIQALHIFEPRYCELLSDALESDRLITMAILEHGWEEKLHGLPKLSNIVCIGRIVSHSPTGDGRHNVFLAGIQRARIVEELEVTTHFRQARVEILEDIPVADEAKSESFRDDLLAIFRSMVPVDLSSSESFSELLTRQLPLGVLTDVIAYAVNLPLATKHYLLGEPDVEARYRLLVDSLTTLVESDEDPDEASRRVMRRGFPPPFSAN
jgi:Lon protease-like protein